MCLSARLFTVTTLMGFAVILDCGPGRWECDREKNMQGTWQWAGCMWLSTVLAWCHEGMHHLTPVPAGEPSEPPLFFFFLLWCASAAVEVGRSQNRTIAPLVFPPSFWSRATVWKTVVNVLNKPCQWSNSAVYLSDWREMSVWANWPELCSWVNTPTCITLNATDRQWFRLI